MNNIEDRIQSAIKSLREIHKELREVHKELIADSSLKDRIPVAGEDAAEVNSPALYLKAGIRNLETARASLSRLRPRRTVDGPVTFTCDLYGHSR